jgi:hypothetical protein
MKGSFAPHAAIKPMPWNSNVNGPHGRAPDQQGAAR